MQGSSVRVSPSGEPTATGRVRGLVALAFVLLFVLIVPLIVRIANAERRDAPPATYLPALEGPRERESFDTNRIDELSRLKPGFVVIGDSMAGTRIDDRRLGARAGRPVALLLQPGSGSAYLVSRAQELGDRQRRQPRVVFVFFRDTNLTDVLFRLDEHSAGRSTPARTIARTS